MMEWWQIALLIAGFVAGGLLVGLLTGRLIMRRLTGRLIFRKRKNRLTEAEMTIRPLTSFGAMITFEKLSLPAKSNTDTEASSEKANLPATSPEPEVVFETTLSPDESGLLFEVKENLDIAKRPWNNELIPFQTREWDNGRKGFAEMPPGMQENLNQAYMDIRLANNIVWLSQELGHRTAGLNESYQKLLGRIASRLVKIYQS